MIKRANLRFTYPFVLGLVLGILTAYFYVKSKSLYAVIVNAVALVLFVCLFYAEKRKLLISLTITFVVFFIGFFYFKALYEHYLSLNLPQGLYNVSGQVESVYEVENGCYVVLKNATLEQGFKLTGVKVRAVITGGNVKVGDNISFKGEVTFLLSNAKNASSFVNGITHSTSVDYSEITTYTAKKTIFEKVNLFIKNAVYKNNPKNVASVSYAMLTGNTAFIESDTLKSFRFAGVAHIFAVSGLHIGFLAHFLNFLLARIKLKKIYRTFVVTAILVFYSGVCNFTVSSIRAVIMCFTLMLCSSLGKKYDLINSLFISMFVTLLIDPFNLFEVGFQLSYSAVFGIGTISVPLAKKLRFLPEKIASAFAVTVAATVATLPISVNAFGYISAFSVLFNLILIPMIYPIFIALIVCVLFSMVAEKCFLFFIPRVFIKGLMSLLKVISTDKIIIKNVAMTYGLITYYPAIILAGDKIRIRRVGLRITVVSILFISSILDLLFF